MNSPLLGATIVSALVACGVTDVVLAPGSRNAALALALHRADAHGDLRLHVRIDERVAAFTALGLAKGSGRVVAVVTTSGSAVGNLVPAAMEARAAGVGLMLITADRPAEAIGTGANQTGEQVGAFGPAALATVRVSSHGNEAAWGAAVQRAHVTAAGLRTRRPGPVHLNAEFSPPLVGAVPAPAFRAAEVHGSHGVTVYETSDARDTVVLVGDASWTAGVEARALAELAGLPLLAEPSSNARTGPCAIAHYRLLLDSAVGQRIRRVVCFGHPTLSRPVNALLSRQGVEVIVVADRAEWGDVSSRAAAVVDRVLMPEGDPAWLDAWRTADMHVAQRRGHGWDGHTVAAAVVASVGRGDALFLGSSQSIRDADLAPISARPARTWANRGLAGIDGTLSTATGVALATGLPTTVLLGDLTLQHDMGALVAPPLEPGCDIRVVVVHDDGGAIFSTLEQGGTAYDEAFERVFGTPQGVDLAAVATALGWQTSSVADPLALEAALAGPVSGRQMVIASLTRDGRRAAEASLHELGRDAG
ncbi:2-succinyl-5-enolpyruvyl-6-hydroxy-3-cyclohexene-1-carboxylic-acid synthase [Tessaracoccus antarcticus]|uniref:2-succinyl-5-enolpyruvyl-6-hydroxy-3- cyclohexene-1-carboxylic-acid synthase n=1 Tax=Tessaracoccus antarcticus TaxID=2479848 RepID=UPI001F1E9700|nr:2-succinyl-5-enolpyruvyl-6-hydroxy-3-cyclohexene-1-carboxylic-acid synthase [Tessaracoccus antarcticus]